ncbi:MAG TPA: DUF3179 domain-containing (seleno)protein [Thermoanaerobaculia bacterium]|nr:DUF3179 domain-containing (seleno)protein [Thermoanaerobaculia bacterium]
MSRRTVPALFIVGLLAGGCLAHQYRSNPQIAVVEGDPIVQMAAPSRFPSVVKPPLVAPDLHSDPPDKEERLIGRTVGAVARAYPIGLLVRFEVVNDGVPDLPFVIARCALTAVAAVYDRRVGAQTLRFDNSGALWRDTLVLQDRETGTYWSAATGRALWGPLAGKILRPVPALFTQTENWARVFPQSLYLDLDDDTSAPLLMRLYGKSPWQGISGEKTADQRHGPKDSVFAVTDAEHSEALAFTEEELARLGSVRAMLAGEPLSIEWDPDLETPRAYAAGPDRIERAVVPMYWFALARHFATVRTLGDVSGSPSTAPATHKR